MSSRLSIVVPMFNEADRMDVSLRLILEYVAAKFPGSEVILVNDGSRDDTGVRARALVREFSQMLRGNVVGFPENRGKGAAVREGMLRATGDVRVFADADNATPIEELSRLLPLVKDENTVVIGSRAVDRTRIEIHQPWWREWGGRSIGFFVRSVLSLPFGDTQCGFKLFGRRAAEVCFSRQTIESFGFDGEILWIARLEKFPVVEVPVRWRHIERSSVRPIRDSLRMARDSILIRLRHPQGKSVS